MSRAPDERVARLAVRATDAEGFADYVRTVSDGFDEHVSEGSIERYRSFTEYGRFLGAWTDDGQLVGTAGSFGFTLAVPGGAQVPCAGLTVVTVRQDHRRRGLLRRLLGAVHDQAADRGEPVGALWASQSPIYGRFGYGPALPTVSLEVPLASARFRRDVDVSGVRFVGVDQALDVFPRIRDAAARRRPGMLSRSAEHWRAELLDLPEDRDGAGPRRLAVLEDRGYVLYRLRPDETRGYPDGTVEVQELVAVDPEATAILYRFVCATDLATRLRAHARPVDDPLPLLVEDQARVEVRAWAPVYLRLLDLPRALVWRRYLGADRLVLEVADASRPANDGRWALEVTAGEATCTATTDAPDLVLDTRELAAAFLGGVPLARAAEAGHVEVRTPGAALRFDRLAAVPLAAWHTGMF